MYDGKGTTILDNNSYELLSKIVILYISKYSNIYYIQM